MRPRGPQGCFLTMRARQAGMWALFVTFDQIALVPACWTLSNKEKEEENHKRTDKQATSSIICRRRDAQWPAVLRRFALSRWMGRIFVRSKSLQRFYNSNCSFRFQSNFCSTFVPSTAHRFVKSCGCWFFFYLFSLLLHLFSFFCNFVIRHMTKLM